MVPTDLQLPIAAIVLGVSAFVIAGGARMLAGGARVAWILGGAGWLAVTGLLAQRGAFARVDGPPLLPLCVATALVASVLIARSQLGARLAQAPLAVLIGLQAFRLPLELAMHHGAGRGVPIELTFAGFNFDIVTGTSALVLAVLVAVGHAPRWLIVAWSILGLACLAVIAGVAIATLPRLHAFGVAPQHLNTWVAHVPFSWVPAVLVPVALGGHLLVLRALHRRS
ncbi:MAG: hypothetical protein M3680_25720 [Myxococcota bacterium]|nr:hypothetical protein [Myxococcota bacterium]